jgi:hypothetical protein
MGVSALHNMVPCLKIKRIENFINICSETFTFTDTRRHSRGVTHCWVVPFATTMKLLFKFTQDRAQRGCFVLEWSWNTHTMNIATRGEIRTALFFSMSSCAERLQQCLHEIHAFEFRSPTDCTITNQWRCHNCSCETRSVEKLTRYIV